MSISVFAYQHGIYPRSEQVVTATRSLDRGRLGADAVEAAYAQDLARFIEVQHEAGLDFFSDGLLRWQDIFRPLANGLGPRAPEELVRWFDTNTFFRAPEVSSIDTLSAAGALPATSAPQPRVLSLPSPYMFSRAAHQASNRNRLMQELAGRVLRPVMESAAAAGTELIHLEEPWLTYYGMAGTDWKPFSDALGTMASGLRAKVILHCYFGDAGPYINRLKELPVHGIGVDLVETDVAALAKGWEDRALLVGCLDGRSSVLESVDDTVDVVRHIADTAHPLDLYLSSNCELQYLPTAVAERKVLRLGEAARRARELVSV